MHNVYQAPDAEVVSEQSREDDFFYVVSAKKFWLLLMITCGFYNVYWFYRHWALYKKRTAENMWPVMRGLFAIFFTHHLYAQFGSRSRMAGSAEAKSLTGAATFVVVLSIISNILGRMTVKGIGSPFTDFIELALVPIIGVFLWKGQKVANLVCGDPTGSTNSRLTGANWVWVFLGVIFWLLILIGFADMFGFLSIEEY